MKVWPQSSRLLLLYFIVLSLASGCMLNKRKNTIEKEPVVFVFLHGGPFNKDYFEPFFADDTKPSIFYSQKVSEHKTPDDAVFELEKLLKQYSSKNGYSNFILVGHSWGSILISYFAHKHLRKGKKTKLGKQISGVALVTAFLHSEQEDMFQKRFQRAYPKKDTIYYALLSDKELTSKKEIPFKGKLYTPKEIVDWALREWDKGATERLIKKSFDDRPIISQLDIPVLNVVGSQDRRHLTDYIIKFEKLGPHVENLVIRDAGGFPFLLERHRKALSQGLKDFANKIQK